jgi:hypothetical protein
MDFGIRSLLFRNYWLLLVEFAHRVVLRASAHLIVLDGENVQAYPSSLTAGASPVLGMPEALDPSFGHWVLIIGMANNPVVEVGFEGEDTQR